MKRSRAQRGYLLPRRPIRLATAHSGTPPVHRGSLIRGHLFLLFRLRQRAVRPRLPRLADSISIVNRTLISNAAHVLHVNNARSWCFSKCSLTRFYQSRIVRQLISRLRLVTHQTHRSVGTTNYRYRHVSRHLHGVASHSPARTTQRLPPQQHSKTHVRTQTRQFTRLVERSFEHSNHSMTASTHVQKILAAFSTSFRASHERLRVFRERIMGRLIEVPGEPGAATGRTRHPRHAPDTSRLASTPIVHHLFERGQRPILGRHSELTRIEQRAPKREAHIELTRRVLPVEIRYREQVAPTVPQVVAPKPETVTAPAFDIERISDNVMRTISKKMKVERERRGQL